jgi:hypothetical protein
MYIADNDYHAIENFIDPEYCKYLSDYFIKNQLQDPQRSSWGYIPFGGNAEFFQSTEFMLEFDPLNKINQMLHYSRNFFLDTYSIDGEFSLNRSHANLMREGAQLDSHKDDRERYQPVEELVSKTYVSSLLLNDDYEGGNLIMGEESKVSIKPKAGTLILFPGYNTRHEVEKVKSGTRVNVLSWFVNVVK